MHILLVNYYQNLINYPQRSLMWLLNTVPTNPTKQISTFPEDFQETFTKLTNEITVILFIQRLYLILAYNYWAATLIAKISDSVYHVNVT